MELPEIEKLSKQMDLMLSEKEITNISFNGDKFLNLSTDEFANRIKLQTIVKVFYRGKIVIITLTNDELIIISTGMGADVLYFDAVDKIKPGKANINLLLKDGSGFTIRFWWFGKFHLIKSLEFAELKFAPDPFSKIFTYNYLRTKIRESNTTVKAFLLNQKIISGIGNMYVHDILFKAQLHPQKKLNALTEKDIENLYFSVKFVLESARKKGAFQYDLDFFGQHGEFTINDFAVGYKEGLPCPECENIIIKIKTGSNSGYICPNCQTL